MTPAFAADAPENGGRTWPSDPQPGTSAWPYSSTNTAPMVAIVAPVSPPRPAGRSTSASNASPSTPPASVAPINPSHTDTCKPATTLYATSPPTIANSPCAKLTARVDRRMMWIPSAIRPYSLPTVSPAISSCSTRSARYGAPHAPLTAFAMCTSAGTRPL